MAKRATLVLVANTVATQVLEPAAGQALKRLRVRVLSQAATPAPVYFAVGDSDGAAGTNPSDPTVAGADMYAVGVLNGNELVIDLADNQEDGVRVKLISAQTPTLAVEGLGANDVI